MQVIRSPQGTNFRVTGEEWAALEKLIDDVEIETFEDYVEPSFDAIAARIKQSGSVALW